MSALEFVVRLLAAAVVAAWLRGVPLERVEYGAGDEDFGARWRSVGCG